MELGWEGDKIMTHFEQMEQTNIFEFIELKPISIRNFEFSRGDLVKIQFYPDEYKFISSSQPQL